LLAQLEEAGDLDEYLTSVGERAEEMLDYLMRQYATAPAAQALPYLDRYGCCKPANGKRKR